MYKSLNISEFVVTKETSQILLQTLWHLWKRQINLGPDYMSRAASVWAGPVVM